MFLGRSTLGIQASAGTSWGCFGMGCPSKARNANVLFWIGVPLRGENAKVSEHLDQSIRPSVLHTTAHCSFAKWQ
jgi:hypothetical protein